MLHCRKLVRAPAAQLPIPGRRYRLDTRPVGRVTGSRASARGLAGRPFARLKTTARPLCFLARPIPQSFALDLPGGAFGEVGEESDRLRHLVGGKPLAQELLQRFRRGDCSVLDGNVSSDLLPKRFVWRADDAGSADGGV